MLIVYEYNNTVVQILGFTYRKQIFPNVNDSQKKDDFSSKAEFFIRGASRGCMFFPGLNFQGVFTDCLTDLDHKLPSNMCTMPQFPNPTQNRLFKSAGCEDP